MSPGYLWQNNKYAIATSCNSKYVSWEPKNSFVILPFSLYVLEATGQVEERFEASWY